MHVFTPLAFLNTFSFVSLVHLCRTVWPPSMRWSNVAELWVDLGLHHPPEPDCICSLLELTTFLN